MAGRRRSIGFVAGVAASLSLCVAIGTLLAPAVRASSYICDYNASTHKVKLTLTGTQSSLLTRDESGKILVSNVWSIAWCDGAATVLNTDQITILAGAGDQTVWLGIKYGGFRPGFTDERGSGDEIEISISLGGGDDTVIVDGTTMNDRFVVGRSSGFAVMGRINLNAGESSGIDADVTLTLFIEDLILSGHEGNDLISGAGGKGTGDSFNGPMRIQGGPGSDSLEGGAKADSIDGFSGADTLRGGAGNDDIDSSDGVGGNDEVIGGPGDDHCVTDSGDQKRGCES